MRVDIRIPEDFIHVASKQGKLVLFQKVSVNDRYSLIGQRFLRWLKWSARKFTDRKVRGSSPTSASRLPLSRLGQLGSIPAHVLSSSGMAARHRKGVTAERFDTKTSSGQVSRSPSWLGFKTDGEPIRKTPSD
ncbi:hypothetical protein CSKR_106562 [Clonorchis sinensis]|uniref:Uncharacterized protein n=1 Tax=Clonorchis sinensis TaxID=79923 RepID=A0A419Q470_CLOSI|nr:hypothetical protein CSKR_106562 [Clonorchis sinensis]